MKVKFNQVEEFCAELEKDAEGGVIDRRIVRCSSLWEASKLSLNIHHVSFLATYSVREEVIELRRYCGDIWRINQENDKKVLDKAEQIGKIIEEVCRRHKLEVRAGYIEEKESK